MMMVLVEVQRHSWREHHGQRNGQSVIWHACQLLTHLTLRGASDSPGGERVKLHEGETDKRKADFSCVFSWTFHLLPGEETATGFLYSFLLGVNLASVSSYTNTNMITWREKTQARA